MTLPHWIRHAWGPWTRPRLYANRAAVFTVERRLCRTCGKTQITTTDSVRKEKPWTRKAG